MTLLIYKTPSFTTKTQATAKKIKPIPMEIFTLFFFLFISTTKTGAQTAVSPSPPGPTNVTAILEKGGQFTTLIRLLKITQIADQINNQLNNSNSGMTIFAPSDNAFSNLPAGTLNSLTDQQKVSLIQFHILPNALSMAQFQTVSNPLRTQAGNSNKGQFPLNVTAMGNNVNISTGIVNTTVSNTLYSDSQLVVYQVDKVLLPLAIFRPAAEPTPAPAEPKKKPAANDDDEPTSPAKDSTDSNSADSLHWRNFGGILFIAYLSLFWWINL